MGDGRRYEITEAQLGRVAREAAEEVCRAGFGGAAPLPKCMNTGRGIQVFSQWDTDGVNFLPVPNYQGRRLVQFEPPYPMWVQASCFGVEVERVTDDATAQAQLEATQIQDTGRQYSLLRWRLSWGGAGGGQEREMDVGPGTVVSVFACATVTIEALYPTGAYVGVPGPRSPTFTGRKLDTLLGAELVPGQGDGSVGPFRGRITTAHLGTGALQLVPVPAGARRVQLSSTTNPITLLWGLGAANSDGTAASVGSIVIGAERVVEVAVPGLARFLILPAALQRIVAVWELDL